MGSVIVDWLLAFAIVAWAFVGFALAVILGSVAVGILSRKVRIAAEWAQESARWWRQGV